jgi:hypothetical protein
LDVVKHDLNKGTMKAWGNFVSVDTTSKIVATWLK